MGNANYHFQIITSVRRLQGSCQGLHIGKICYLLFNVMEVVPHVSDCYLLRLLSCNLSLFEDYSLDYFGQELVADLHLQLEYFVLIFL